MSFWEINNDLTDDDIYSSSFISKPSDLPNGLLGAYDDCRISSFKLYNNIALMVNIDVCFDNKMVGVFTDWWSLEKRGAQKAPNCIYKFLDFLSAYNTPKPFLSTKKWKEFNLDFGDADNFKKRLLEFYLAIKTEGFSDFDYSNAYGMNIGVEFSSYQTKNQIVDDNGIVKLEERLQIKSYLKPVDNKAPF